MAVRRGCGRPRASAGASRRSWRRPSWPTPLVLGLHRPAFDGLTLRSDRGRPGSARSMSRSSRGRSCPARSRGSGRTRRTGRRRSTAPAPARLGRPPAPPLPFRAPRDEDDDARPRPRPRVGAAGARRRPPRSARASGRCGPETLGDRVAQACAPARSAAPIPRLLTAAERAICDERFGLAAAGAAPIDGTAEQPVRPRRRPRASPTTSASPSAGRRQRQRRASDGVGSNSASAWPARIWTRRCARLPRHPHQPPRRAA